MAVFYEYYWKYILAGMLILCIISVINALTYKGEDTAEELAFWAMLIKLAHVPFFVCVFLAGAVMLPAALFTILVVISWAVYLLLFIIDYIFMLSSSAYSIKAIWSAKKEGIIDGVVAVTFTIFSFIFVTDVICAILNYIFIRISKK